MEKVRFFSADYRNGRVRIGGKTYPAGYYCVHLLNQYYKDDTAARISVFADKNWMLQKQLRIGYINEGDFLRAGEEMLHIFHALPWLKPFDRLDMDAERNRVVQLFTEENAHILTSYFQSRAAVGSMSEGRVLCHILPKEYDKAFFDKAERLLNEVCATLQFYDRMAKTSGRHFRSWSALLKTRMRPSGWMKHICFPSLWKSLGNFRCR